MSALPAPPLTCFRWLLVKSLTDSLLRVNVRTLTRPLVTSFLPVLFFLVTMTALLIKRLAKLRTSQRTPVSQIREMIALTLPPLICFRWLAVKFLTDSLLTVNVRTLTRPLFTSFLPALFFLVTITALLLFVGVPQRSWLEACR